MTNQSKITIDRKDILGRGGYGAIFKGSLSVNNKDGVEGTEIIDVAVKRLEIDTLEMNMKERELKQMELNHPNVVKLLHYEEDYNFMYTQNCYYRFSDLKSKISIFFFKIFCFRTLR